MDNFDKKVQETLKQLAEGVNPSPHVEQRIHDEILSRCPELRKQIAILFGGCSPEYSVSLQSAYSVITHIDRKKYTPVLIGISNAGDWFRYGKLKKFLLIHGAMKKTVFRLSYLRAERYTVF